MKSTPRPEKPYYRPGPAPRHEKDGSPAPHQIPKDLHQRVEPTPRFEQKSPGGNNPHYEVLGKQYKVLPTANGFREVGLASWYGTKFHGRRTSNGEVYDMFDFTAAHKHLPLPTYVRVTNLANGKNVVLRVNDRGPFHEGRVIDLSYLAATRLDLVDTIGMVEVEAITPGQDLPPPTRLAKRKAPKPRSDGLLQVAAYSDPINAVAMREELRSNGFGEILIRSGRLNNGKPIHRVMVGPFSRRQQLEEMRIRVRQAGYQAFPVVQ
ncbi:MAG: septal ring lytic transglycosylase RlpA family protein [Panacagrimonas sp.]